MGAFHLTRYFSTLSFALIVLVGGALALFLHQQESAQLKRMAEDRNVAMTRVFGNALWLDFAPIVNTSADRSADALRRQVEQRGLYAKASALMRDSEAIKIKVFNLDGLTVFSSDPRQIGEDRRNNPGFIAAAAGNVVSELTHRNQFGAFEGDMTDIDVLSSYVPIREQGRLVGVFEVYQDVTSFMRQINQSKWLVGLTVLGVLGALYLVQLLLVRRAQAILRHQADQLEAANCALDHRVQERTAELQAEIVERRSAEWCLDHLAHHDPLTGLPNRLMFAEQLKKSIHLTAREAQQLAVLFIDLDRFKTVNDTLGHAVGDELLVAVTHRLKSCLRTGDFLARLGGDEFICIIEDVKDARTVGIVADKLIKWLSQPFQIVGHELYVAASIGICFYPSDGKDVDALVRNADTAMYQAKAHGRSRSHFYTPEMTTYAQERIRLDALLRRAIEANELALHYQIKVDIEGRPTGAEALLRWTSAELGAVPPVRFIPLAEETGFIVDLGEWVLRQACRQMMTWRVAGWAMPKMAINLSVKQIDRGNIVEVVRAILDETGLEPAAVELEITESVIMNIEDALSILNKLHQIGVQLAVDDFGTGYSSLAYLKLLPINTLKIDRSFVIGIGDNAGDEAIIRTVIALAHSLKLATVAEGVESAHQVDFLRTHGCDEIQGYFFGKPQPADAFAESWRQRG
ncbi:MAG: EAL domain-containing protein [Candidatus Competibacter sp.]|nr:EAL domain-containing protein [Candidatus Competibacter sp.]MDG4606061.1 EAL domain-containing protein [Candidatus Contendobacter sp.]HRD50653.1 EAL domain-containing protein [Candidatus Contendobacter sp.]